MSPRRCQHCADPFTPSSARQRFCSPACGKIAWRENNRARHDANQRRYTLENKEKKRAYYAEWCEKNQHVRTAHEAKRRATKLRATPAWANQGAMAMMYRMAKEQARAHCIDVHVDHIVPLNHPTVCGLHCEDNLQLMFAEDNNAKKNSWWPNMWGPE